MIIQLLKGNCVTIEVSKNEIKIPFMLEELQKTIVKLVKELVPSIYIIIAD